MTRTTKEIHAHAVALANGNRLVAADRSLRAVNLSEVEPDLHARILATRALIRARLGDLSEAERLCDEAFTIEAIHSDTRAVLAGQAGAIAEYAGRLDDAERWLGEALSGTKDPVAAARMRMNRSVIAMQRGALGRAVSDARLAATAFAAHGMPEMEAQARHNRGYAEMLRGDLVAGLREMESARPILAETSPASAAISDMDRAELLRDAGLTREAERLLAQAADALRVARQPRMRADAELALARSLLTHDPERARAVGATAARLYARAGNEVSALRAEAVRLRAELALGPSPQRRSTTRPGRQIDEVVLGLEAAGLRHDAEVLRVARDLAEVDGPGRAASVRRIPTSAPIELRTLAAEARAAGALAAGRNFQARKCAAAGLDQLVAWQAAFGSLDLQTSIVMYGGGLLRTGLKAALRSGRPDVIFDWSERARHLSSTVVPLRPPPDEEAAADLEELRMLRWEDADALESGRAAGLRDRVRARQWSMTGSISTERRVSLPEMREALGSDTALLAYVYSGEELNVLLITDDVSLVIDLPRWSSDEMAGLRADLDMHATVRQGPLASIVAESLRARLARLSGVLLDDVVQLCGNRRVVLTAPGVLGGIPWGMLPGMRHRVFTVAASATRWASFRGHPHRLEDAAFVVGPRVPRGEEESLRAREAWVDATIVVGATTGDVVRLAGSADVLHIAAHGRHAAENPMFSGLELADGTLFGYDIDLMPEVPDTVILSACEVGRSSVRWGEEAIGMTRIWLHAGTRCVIAAPVVVADDVACELLGEMHQGLAAGLAPAVALAEASERTGIVAPFQAHGSGF